MRVQLDPGAFLPERAHEWDAGLDIRTPVTVTLQPGSAAVIDTGVHAEIPKGFVGLLKSKSGLNVKYGITSEGVIDAGYTGSIRARLVNGGQETVRFERGDKVTQLVVVPCLNEICCEGWEPERTERGDSGFGSSGR